MILFTMLLLSSRMFMSGFLVDGLISNTFQIRKIIKFNMGGFGKIFEKEEVFVISDYQSLHLSLLDKCRIIERSWRSQRNKASSTEVS